MSVVFSVVANVGESFRADARGDVQMPTSFTPISSLAGGAVIGLSAVMLMGFLGRIAGVSGIVGGVISGSALKEGGWRLAFIIGMIAAPLPFLAVTGALPAISVPPTLPMLAIGGLIVGVGVYFGSGCTSGHGVCGMARVSPRSIAATLTFMATTAATVFVIRHVMGG